MINAHAHPSDVVGDVVDAIGHRPPEFGNGEIVHANILGFALRPPFAPSVLEVADQFLLLGVDRDRRLACGQRCRHLLIDVAKLPVAIRMVSAFAHLAIGLQAVAKRVQQFTDHRAADLMPHADIPGAWDAKAGQRRPVQ